MNILEAFSEREHQYLIYEARQDAMREQLTIESDLEEARGKIAKAQARADKAQARAEEAELEQERLRKLLRSANIDPQA